MAEQTKGNRVQDEIDENLKRVYQEALDEALPDRFLDLLDRLKTEGAEGILQDKSGE